jgi:hypothetical protein
MQTQSQDRRRLPGMQPVSRHGNQGARTVRVRGTPEAVLRLGDVAEDWLFQHCGPDGRAKLLKEHDLVAA